MQRPRSLFRLSFFSGCLIVLGAATAGCSDFGPRSTISATYQVTQMVTQVVVRDAAGNVHVATRSGGDGISVTEARSFRGSPPASTHSVSGGTLTLTYTCPSSDCGIDYTVTVPADLPVTVDASAGDVTLTGLSGAVQVQADAGAVALTDLSGPVRVRADAGEIRGTGLGSRQATLTDSAGSVTLAFTAAPTSLAVQAKAGDVKVTVPGSESYAATATASAGQTRVTVPTSPGSSHVIRAASDAGNVSILGG